MCKYNIVRMSKAIYHCFMKTCETTICKWVFCKFGCIVYNFLCQHGQVRANDAPARLDRKVAFCEVEEEGEEEVDVVVIVVVDSELIRKDEFSRKFVAIRFGSYNPSSASLCPRVLPGSDFQDGLSLRCPQVSPESLKSRKIDENR